ncbi:hypothetical protein [Yoonia sp.]|uniref:hypothetical protein n=1 Tax=Yoonia sp. TaxID=2212373 RepID=UPI003F6CA03C
MKIATEFRSGISGRVPDALILHPSQCRHDQPLVSVHGIARDVHEMARCLAPMAEATGRMVVLPIFDRDHWPQYQRAACRNRADQAFLDLLTALESEDRIAKGPVDLAGFSGGAQFAHRFTWLYPHRIRRLTVSSAGWWTFPDEAAFPYGMGPSKEGPKAASLWLRTNLRAFLDRDIVIRVGAQDCTVDVNTRSGPRIDAQQGHDRLTRAYRWAAALSDAAKDHGLPDRIDFDVLAGCGHDFTACATAGLTKIFLPGACLPERERNVA